MNEYSTRVVVVGDRYVCLQLPADWPEGEASITVRSIVQAQPTGDEAGASGAVSHPIGPTVEEAAGESDEMDWWDEL